MKDVECPYCGEGLEINHDDGYGYAEDETFQQDCGACGKTFVFTTSISFHYDVEKADCLNDGTHNYERTKTWPVEATRLRCTTCGDEKPLPPNVELTGDTKAQLLGRPAEPKA